MSTICSFTYNLLDNHLLPALTPEVNYDKPTYDQPSADRQQKNSVKPGDIKTVIDKGSVEWLNNSFFTYVEPEFLTWVAGASALTQTIPSLEQFGFIPLLLLFRGSVESSRTNLGKGLSQITEAINLDALKSGTGARIPLPKQKFNLFGLLDIEATDLAVEYVSQPDQIFKIQGKLALPSFLGNPSITATSDFVLALA